MRREMEDDMSDDVRPQNDVFKPETVKAPAGAQLAGAQQFEVPVDSVPLPSRGKCYPPTSPLHGREYIDIKAMTAHEEDILTSKALLKNGTVITHLLKSCIVDRTVNPDDMLVGDRTALMIALRITGYGSEYKLDVECPVCETKQQYPFQLADLPVKFLDIDPIAPFTNEFEFVCPLRKNRLTFRLLTGADEAELLVDRQARKKKLGAQLETNVTSNLIRQIVSVDGHTDRNMIAQYVRSMPALDSRMLRKYISDIEPGMEMRGKMTCSNAECGETSEVDVPIGASFFWPDA